MVLGESALTAETGSDRCPQQLGKSAELRPRLGPLNAGAGVDQRSLRRQDGFCGLAHIDRIGRSAHMSYRRVIQLTDVRSPKVGGDLDDAWTTAAVAQPRKCTTHDIRQFV